MDRKEFYADVDEEIAFARNKFPSSDLLLTAFVEEAGELVKAVLNGYHGKLDRFEVRREAKQTVAMIVRLLEEGDPVHKLPSCSG